MQSLSPGYPPLLNFRLSFPPRSGIYPQREALKLSNTNEVFPIVARVVSSYSLGPWAFVAMGSIDTDSVQ